MRVLCISDEFTRQSLSIEARNSFVSERVCYALEQLFERQGVPRMLRLDNGPEFIALALRGLCHQRGIQLGFIAPGKLLPRGHPQNGFAESFHARLRDEFLDGATSASAFGFMASLLERATFTFKFGLCAAE